MSESYQADSAISLTDVHYAPFAPGERHYQLLGDVRGKRILELACGGAQNSVALSAWGADVVSLDISSNQLGFARSLKERSGQSFDLLAGDMAAPLMFRPGSFDLVLSAFGWEFIPDLRGCVRNCAELIRHGGQLLMSTVDAGFPRIKLKAAPGWDLEMLQIVTSTFPDTTFHIDCNSGYTLDDLPFFKAIDGMGLAFIEQPLAYNDLLDHAELARQIGTPICLDESIVDPRTAEQALRIGACRYINIKPGRIGGLTNALAVHDMARDAGVPVWVGGMLESALGGSICVELATLENFTYPGDLFPSSRFYRRDLSQPP